MINVFVSFFRFIWIPKWWVYGRYECSTLSVRGSTLDVRTCKNQQNSTYWNLTDAATSFGAILPRPLRILIFNQFTFLSAHAGAGSYHLPFASLTQVLPQEPGRIEYYGHFGGRVSVADPRGGGVGGWNRPHKKSSLFLGVSLWFGDIRSEKQCPICLRLHEKPLEIKSSPGGGPLDPFTVK